MLRRYERGTAKATPAPRMATATSTNYFTDWFGSTQNRIGSLVQASGRSEVYLVSDGSKHHVSTYEDLVVLGSRLGEVSSVAARYVDELPTGSDAGRYVHDPRTGTLFLLEADGSKHRFVDSDQIALFGYPFASYVNMDPRLIDAFTAGPEVGGFIRSGSEPAVYELESGTRRHIYNAAAWAQVSSGTPGYIGTMATAAAEAIPQGPTRFAANILVRGASSNDVLRDDPDRSADPHPELRAGCGVRCHHLQRRSR